jgi:hypothetical protein
MPAVLMTNPPAKIKRKQRTAFTSKPAAKSRKPITNPPGLALAVIGNPGRSRAATRAGRTAMSTKKSKAKRTHRSMPVIRPRYNPNSVYWRVSSKVPWRTPPTVVLARERSRSRKKRKAKAKAKHHGIIVAPVMRRAPIVRASKPGRRRRTRRNPPATAVRDQGLMGDVRGLGSALAAIGREPAGLLWLGGGAAGTLIAGGVVNAQLGRVLPALSPGMARAVNFANYAGVGILLSRLGRTPRARRQLLAGGLAVALLELAKPGITAPAVAVIPGINRLAQPADPQVAVRTPAVQANPDALAAMAPWYKAGGKLNPLNWLSGLGAVAGSPVRVDGVATEDGQVYGLRDDLPMNPTDASQPIAGDEPPEDGAAGVGEESTLVNTMVGALDCPLTGRANDLNAIVRP